MMLEPYEKILELRAAAKLQPVPYSAAVCEQVLAKYGPIRPADLRRKLHEVCPSATVPATAEAFACRMEQLEIRGLARRYNVLRSVSADKWCTRTEWEGPDGQRGAAYTTWARGVFDLERRAGRVGPMPAWLRDAPASPGRTERWFYAWYNSVGCEFVQTLSRKIETRFNAGANAVYGTAWDVPLSASRWDERLPFERAMYDAVRRGTQPGDPLPAGVYADWLDEHGFPAEAAAYRAWFTAGRAYVPPARAYGGPYNKRDMGPARRLLLHALRPDVVRKLTDADMQVWRPGAGWHRVQIIPSSV